MARSWLGFGVVVSANVASPGLAPFGRMVLRTMVGMGKHSAGVDSGA